MAKNKKVKKKKKKGMRRKKWGPVKTSISVVGGVAGIVGATVLGVYLAGGFNEKIINPESISFVYDAMVEALMNPIPGTVINNCTVSSSSNISCSCFSTALICSSNVSRILSVTSSDEAVNCE